MSAEPPRFVWRWVSAGGSTETPYATSPPPGYSLVRYKLDEIEVTTPQTDPPMTARDYAQHAADVIFPRRPFWSRRKST